MKHSIIIAGDFIPARESVAAFVKGDVSDFFDRRIMDLFSNAEYSAVNLEGTLTDAEQRQKKIGQCIKAPKAAVNGMKALGIKAAAVANNHVTDYLNQGFEDTIDALSSSGIEIFGGGKTGNMKNYVSTMVGNRRVCLYNVSESFFNQPSEDIFGSNLYDEYLVCNEIRELKQTHDYLIVLYHGGAEYLQYPTPMIKKRFHRMADSGADFITAQHTHCIGCEEVYNNSYLLYGQGNFFFPFQRNRLDITTDGLVIELAFSDGDVEVVKHNVKLEGGKLTYVEGADMGPFYERGKHIGDEDYLFEAYRRTMFEDNKGMYVWHYLPAAKGLFPFRRIINKFCPSKMIPYIMKSYSASQIERNLRPLTTDRSRENYEIMWKSLLKNKRK